MTEHESDLAFLLLRMRSAGSCDFTNERWTGMSSNAIVSVAFGEDQWALPSDWSDYAACVRTFRRLPRHRQTKKVRDAMRIAWCTVNKKYPAAERRRYFHKTRRKAA